MPLYDYQCPECGLVEEVFARLDDDPPVHCRPMVRLPSAPMPHQLTGADERARIGEKIKKRNVEFWSSRRGIETIKEDRSGQIDLTKLAAR